MRHLKLVIAATAVVGLLAGFNANAQAAPDAGMGMKQGKAFCKKGKHHFGPGARLDKMSAALGLTSEQRARILPVLDEKYKEQRAIRGDDKLTRDQRREKMQELRVKYHAKVKGFLTPEQRIKADEMLASAAERCKTKQHYMKNGRRGGKRQMNTAARLDKMSACLGLTNDQKSKIAPIFDKKAKEMKALHDDSKLTRDQKREKMQGLRVKFHNDIKALLNPEQAAKLDAGCVYGGKGGKMRNLPMMQDNKPANPPV